MELVKKNLFGVDYSIVDYESASNVIIEKALTKQSFGVSALAVHGLVIANWDIEFRNGLRRINMIVPDGQPIRWTLNNLYDVGLKNRVYGPTLTLEVLRKADKYGLGVFLYGSTSHTLGKFSDFIKRKYPNVMVSGVHVDRFRDASNEEDIADIAKINSSGAHIVLVGRGCPRQEVWVSQHVGKINAVMMAVGAAFDFHAGNVKQAPAVVQNAGLEWLFRLVLEPKRLWKRYLTTNSYFIYLLLKTKIKSGKDI